MVTRGCGPSAGAKRAPTCMQYRMTAARPEARAVATDEPVSEVGYILSVSTPAGPGRSCTTLWPGKMKSTLAGSPIHLKAAPEASAAPILKSFLVDASPG